MDQNQQDIFNARLARLKANGHRLPGDPKVARGSKGRSREVAGNALYPLSLAGAFGLGLIAVGFGRYVRFQLMEGAQVMVDNDLELMITAGIGMAAAFVLAQMFRLNSKEHLSLQGMGVFAGVCLIHNLFHWAPGPMAAAFSPDYVAQMQELTEPNTAIFRGMSFAFAEPAAPVAATSAETAAGPALITLDGADGG